MSTVVLVVDDGSRDDTAAAALRAGALVAQLATNCGGGAALRAGYRVAVTSGASIVVTIDADGQHRPEEIARVVEPVLERTRPSFAAGSRVLGSAEPGAFARELGIAFFNRVVRALTRTQVTDCSNGFRATRTEVLADARPARAPVPRRRVPRRGAHPGRRFEEVPITVLRRAHGMSKKPPDAALRLGVLRGDRARLAAVGGAPLTRAPPASPRRAPAAGDHAVPAARGRPPGPIPGRRRRPVTGRRRSCADVRA